MTSMHRQERNDLARAALAEAKPSGGGEWMRAACPFCPSVVGKQDRSRAFSVNRYTGWFHCFAAETSVLTREGFSPIRALAGKEVQILTTTADGKAPRWVGAPFWPAGVQRLWRVELQRNGVTKVIRATGEHRWFVRSMGGQYQERRTSELLPGMRMKVAAFPSGRNFSVSPWGVAHGFTFGDGTVRSDGRGALALLWGEKDRALLRFFPLSPKSPARTANGVSGVRVTGLPSFFKEPPSLSESPAYLYGWLAGYFAANGCVAEDGMPTLASACRANLEFVQRLCIRLGIFTYGIKGQQRRGYGKDESGLYSLSFARSALTADFFVIPKHRRRWRAHRTVVERRGWVVRSVVQTDVREEVFCASVEGSASFALEGNILVGNCFRCGTAGKLDGMEEVGFERPSKPDHIEPPENFLLLGEEPGASAISAEVARSYLLSRRVKPPLWTKASIGACLRGKYAGRIIVPVLSASRDEWVGWVGRAWSRRAEKPYIYPSGGWRGRALFNHAAVLSPGEVVYIVEGVFDALALWPDGVAVLGKPSAEQVEALSLSKRPVVVVLDGDAFMEGHALAVKLRRQGVTAGSVRLPPKTDPDEVPLADLWEAGREALGAMDAVRI